MLKQAEYIGSRAYSILWGLVGGPENQQSSSALILGGLDQGIAGISPNFTGTLNYRSNCSTRMLVTINDISLNWPNGTDTSIFMGSQSSVIQACIAPSFAGLMTIPYAHWTKFQQLAGGRFPGNFETRSRGINFYTMLYEPEDVFFRDLTISLQNSISIRIPNTQLVVPDRVIPTATGQIVTNSSVRNLVLNSIQEVNINDLPVIGRLLLTSAYLSVNHDSNTFSLWQADVRAEMGRLSSLDEKNDVSDVFCGDETKTDIHHSLGPSPTSSSASPPPPPSPMHLSGGAIGGIGAGAIFSIVSFIVIGCVILRRKRESNTPGINHVDRPLDLPPTPPYHSKPNRRDIPSEMNSERD
ncbi:hypothetical protein K505DRAFT_372428 [Melanomma pulvis-pyrius CBS 109.77]|uniref:Peptidase A1 domain-containing protein n=1 Tax=Melanomma pulvis-pyrius CBS 109.77 TaxID=1314802 RepID=A0A6A6XLT9_9PLEO|nr:hypothetical protein K505DRAFT_372428 [Melanomma pulvis-pyrius CBS 109.77]